MTLQGKVNGHLNTKMSKPDMNGEQVLFNSFYSSEKDLH